MIARDSKSYPYLAIAQYYGVEYGEVLRYSDSGQWKRFKIDRFHYGKQKFGN